MSTRTILILIIGLGLAAITCMVLLLVFVLPFDNSDPAEREDVRLCKTMWEHILYVAKGYERLELFPDDAKESAILYAAGTVSETHDDIESAMEALGKCIDIHEGAGYFEERLRPRGP